MNSFDNEVKDIYTNFAYAECPEYIKVGIYDVKYASGPESSTKEKDKIYNILSQNIPKKLVSKYGPTFCYPNPSNDQIILCCERGDVDFPEHVSDIEIFGKKISVHYLKFSKIFTKNAPNIVLDIFRKMFKDFCESETDFTVKGSRLYLPEDHSESNTYGKFNIPIKIRPVVDFTIRLVNEGRFVIIAFQPKKKFQCTVYDYWKRSILPRKNRYKDSHSRLEIELLEGESKGEVHGLGKFITGNILSIEKTHPKDHPIDDNRSLEDYWIKKYKRHVPDDDFIVKIKSFDNSELYYPASQLAISLKFLTSNSDKNNYKNIKVAGYELNKKIKKIEDTIDHIFVNNLYLSGYEFRFNNDLVSLSELIDKGIVKNVHLVPYPKLLFGIKDGSRKEHGIASIGLSKFGPYSGKNDVLILPILSNLNESQFNHFKKDLKSTYENKFHMGSINFLESICLPASDFDYRNNFDSINKKLLNFAVKEQEVDKNKVILLIVLPPKSEIPFKARMLKMIYSINETTRKLLPRVQFVNQFSIKLWNPNAKYFNDRENQSIKRKKERIADSLALHLYFKIDLDEFKAPWVLKIDSETRKNTIYGGYDVSREYAKIFDQKLKKHRYVEKKEHSVKSAICNSQGMIINFNMRSNQRGEYLTQGLITDIITDTYQKIRNLHEIGRLPMKPNRFFFFKDGKLGDDSERINVREGWETARRDSQETFSEFIFSTIIKDHNVRFFRINHEDERNEFSNPEKGLFLELDIHPQENNIKEYYMITSKVNKFMAKPKKIKIYPISEHEKSDPDEIPKEIFDLCFLNWSMLTDKEGTILPLRITQELGLLAKEGVRVGINESLSYLPL